MVLALHTVQLFWKGRTPDHEQVQYKRITLGGLDDVELSIFGRVFSSRLVAISKRVLSLDTYELNAATDGR